jgi:hypothetical protein
MVGKVGGSGGSTVNQYQNLQNQPTVPNNTEGTEGTGATQSADGAQGTTPAAELPATGLVDGTAQNAAATTTGTNGQPQMGANIGGAQQAGGGSLGFLATQNADGAQRVENTATQAAQENGGIPTSLALERIGDLDIKNTSGMAFQLDSDKVQGMRVNVRKIEHPEHGEGMEINLKLRRGQNMQEVEELIKAKGGGQAEFEIETMRDRGDGTLQIDPEGTKTKFNGKAWELEDKGKYTIELMDNGTEQAVRGTVRIRVYGKDKDEIGQNAKRAVEDAGLGVAVEDSTPDFRERLNKMRVLWQANPKGGQDFGHRDISQIPMAEIDGALREAGVSDEKISELSTEKVFPGHFTTVNPSQSEEYEAHGVKYLFSGVRKKEHVVSILKSDGMMGTMERYQRGIIFNGASSAADLRTGGADYVFTRMVTPNAAGKKISSSYAAGDYQLVYKPDILDRTDWFAYNKDNYGNTKDEKFENRLTGKELVDSVDAGGYGGKFATSNEVMFQRGIPSSDVDRIMTPTQQKKDDLIAALTEAGITEVGGKPLDQAIEVRDTYLDAPPEVAPDTGDESP